MCGDYPSLEHLSVHSEPTPATIMLRDCEVRVLAQATRCKACGHLDLFHPENDGSEYCFVENCTCVDGRIGRRCPNGCVVGTWPPTGCTLCFGSGIQHSAKCVRCNPGAIPKPYGRGQDANGRLCVECEGMGVVYF